RRSAAGGFRSAALDLRGGSSRVCSAILALLFAAVAAAAEPYAVGAQIAPLELADPHDQPHRVDASGRALLLARDMQAGDIVKQALAADGAALLGAAHAAYVADVSGMPALVLRLFALRKLRERPYPVLLDRDGSQTARFPVQTGKVGLFVLDALRVKEIRYL